MEVQDDKLNMVSSGKVKLVGSSTAQVERIKLIHTKGKEGAWIVYNAISAYME